MPGDESEKRMFTKQFLAVLMEIIRLVGVVCYECMSICELFYGKWSMFIGIPRCVAHIYALTIETESI